jgi:hypothetical protein
MKGSKTSLPSLPPRGRRPTPTPPAAAAAAPPAAPAPVATSVPDPSEPKQSNIAKAAAGAAAVAAGAAAAAATAAAAASAPAPPAPAYTEPDAAALKEAADAAVKETTDAIAAGNAAAAAQAAENMEDVVDDQIALTNEEAVEAVVGLIDAAVDAEEAAADAETILQHAEEEAAETTPEAVAAAVAVVEETSEDKSDDEMPELTQPTPADAPAAVEEVANSAAPSLPARKNNKKKSGGAASSKQTPDQIAAAAAAAAAEIDELTREEAPALLSAEVIPDEAEDQVERLDQIPHPTLDFSQAPSNDAPMTELEEKIQQMSLKAHQRIKDNPHQLVQASKEQGAAFDLAIIEGAGKVRPSLVAACAFSYSDMVLAQRQVSESKAALAVAYDACHHLEGRNAIVRALTSYAYILRAERKPKSTRLCFEEALAIAKEENGLNSTQVEQVKYEYTSYLAKGGYIDHALKVLIGEGEALEAEAEKLDKEAPSEEERKKTEEEEAKAKAEAAAKKAAEVAATADPGTGLDHIAAEEEAVAALEAQNEGRKLLPNEQARHFAMRSFLHASELLDATGKFEEGEALLAKALDAAVSVHGESSIQHMNVLYSLGQHYRRQGRIEEAINAHENVLNMMDDTIEVYEPELLQNRVAILRDTAILYDKAGDPTTALDYATGALVNAQTLSSIMGALPNASPALAAGMLEPFFMLLAGLKAKTGDLEGAAEASKEAAEMKRLALVGKMNQGRASRGGKAGGKSSGKAGQKEGSGGRGRGRTTGPSTTRAGGRRV